MGRDRERERKRDWGEIGERERDFLHLSLQMFPMATVCGNTYVVKPSEQDPGATMLLMEMAKEAGLPDGVVNVIHGQKEGK